ncbi:uncharacterized protein LOC144119203 [Amblyomma americanum]
MAAAGTVVTYRLPEEESPLSPSDTVSPSGYLRNVQVITRETTSVTNSRERFVLIAMSALLVLISCTLFAILFALLSEDLGVQPTGIIRSTIKFLWPESFLYNFECLHLLMFQM